MKKVLLPRGQADILASMGSDPQNKTVARVLTPAIQACNYQLSKSMVHEIKFGDKAVV